MKQDQGYDWFGLAVFFFALVVVAAMIKLVAAFGWVVAAIWIGSAASVSLSVAVVALLWKINAKLGRIADAAAPDQKKTGG